MNQNSTHFLESINSLVQLGNIKPMKCLSGNYQIYTVIFQSCVFCRSINAFKIFQEAQFYIKRELREKNNWDEESNVVKQFDQLIKRRFS